AEPELKKVKEEKIKMNHPLKFDGYTIYQSGYQQNEFNSMTFKIHKKNDPDEASLGSFKINLSNPKDTYKLNNGFSVTVSQYYPDYEMEEGEPRSKTNYPRNPAFVFRVSPPGTEQSELSLVGVGKSVDANGET